MLSQVYVPAIAQEPVQAPVADTQADLLQRLKNIDTWEDAQQKLEVYWQVQGTQTEQVLVKRAKNAFVNQAPIQALEHSADVVAYNPAYAYGWRVYGQIAAAQEKTGVALHSFLQAVALQPKDYIAWTSLGMLFTRIDRLQEAKYAYEQAFSISPFDARTKQELESVTIILNGQAL